MLLKLSTYHAKLIALAFLCVFSVSGFAMIVNPPYRISNNKFYAGLYSNYSLGSKKNENRSEEVISTSNSVLKPSPKELKSNVLHADYADAKPDSLQIGGPGQPEMSTFKSVGADNMVSLFSGDFNYNIPLMDVGGYPINAFYNSGIGMDDEASWVGLGWNINPGTITRNMRGVPDDFNGKDIIEKHQFVSADKTWGVSGGLGAKFAGFPLSADINLGLSFNNKLGVAAEVGIHPSLNISAKSADGKTMGLTYGGSLSLNMNSRTGASITPSISLGLKDKDATSGETTTTSIGAGFSYSSRMGISSMHVTGGVKKSIEAYKTNEDKKNVLDWANSGEADTYKHSSSISFLYPTITPSTNIVFTRSCFNVNLSLGGEAFAFNGHGRFAGYYMENFVDEKDQITEHPAFGFLHYQKANEDKNAMLDFNRTNETSYTPATPAIAMPMYTYDIFSINGEGTGGVFRAYRNDIGFMRDASTESRDQNGSVGLDLGIGGVAHGGVELSYAHSPTNIGGWYQNNLAATSMEFKANKGIDEAVYFRNPGEKSVPDWNYQEAIGGESLVRLKLNDPNTGTPSLLPSLVMYDDYRKVTNTTKILNNLTTSARDRRTQVIGFLTNEEAEKVGFDKQIACYSAEGQLYENKVLFGVDCYKDGITFIDRNVDNTTNPTGNAYRKSHHISEINVLGTDGRKYVYGIPVYNTTQTEATFSINNHNDLTGLSDYSPGNDDVVALNPHTKDNYVSKQIMPAYTHSFLLTALVSPNYVDVTNNGITEDDLGDAVKFNYSKFENFKWRTPSKSNSASYSEGLKTDKNDDKAHYIYGEREMFYLYSIESKNLVARFYVKNDRKDGKSVLNIAGGISSTGMRRLDKISLFSKADLIKFGDNAKPIKTVKLFQSDKLCIDEAGLSNRVQGSGKLRLDSIWFIYNNNQKVHKTRYVFYYPDGSKNPKYAYNANDRWGNYKPNQESDPAQGTDPNNNFGGLDNDDFPYSVQDKARADKYASAWTMNKILLPSGGVIKIDYESDDYAFVQERRACQMFQVSGFGPSAAPTPSELTNKYLYNGSGVEFQYVYLKLSKPIQVPSSVSIYSNEIKEKLRVMYFNELKQLYMRLWIRMPSSPGLPGGEFIAVHADIEDFGLVNNTGTIAYVKVVSLANNRSPMVQAAFQFIRQQLPGKAYPNYDMSEEGGMRGIVSALGGMAQSFGELISGVENRFKRNWICSEVDLAKSYSRLTSPTFSKLGGGLRVKKVTISDNWIKMTGQNIAEYGQEYVYTKKETINGKEEIISSGVASWEPSVGQDENPYKEIMRFVNANKGAPKDFGAVELPLGEVFYPSPSVGYSRVEVLSINRTNVKNQPTRQVNEFYTTREFPFKSICTPLHEREANVEYKPSNVLQLLKLDLRRAVTQSQGFLVTMNDMNGKQKEQATYLANDGSKAISRTEYFYNTQKASDNTYRFNHDFPTIEDARGLVEKRIIGRDIELMADFREHKTQTTTVNLSVNFDFFFVGIFPVPLSNLLQPAIFESTTYRSASLLKIVNHYSILDSIVVTDKGSMVSTKNITYDAETGNVLLTRTNNEHNRPIYNLKYPAYWAYAGMGPAYKNIGATYSGLTFVHGRLIGSNIPASIFESGDELYVVSENDYAPAIQPTWCSSLVNNTPAYKSNTNRVWVINTGKMGSLTPENFFIDEMGTPYHAQQVTIKIIRSGKRNLLDQIVASITSRENPIKNGALFINDQTQIIQTTAATFKEHWRVDEQVYKLIQETLVVEKYKLRKLISPPIDYFSMEWNNYHGNSQFNGLTKNGYLLNHLYLSRTDPWVGTGASTEQRASAFTLFNLADLPADVRIFKSTMDLYSHSSFNRKSSTINQPTQVPIHPHRHSDSDPHNIIPGENTFSNISAIKTDWFNTNNSLNSYSTWLNNVGFGNLNNVSSNPGIIPPANTAYEDYSGQQSRDVSNTVRDAMGYNLFIQGKKIGFRISLQTINDPIPGNGQWRTSRKCFSAVSPKLNVYYYKCGDVTPHSSMNGDDLQNHEFICNTYTTQATTCPSVFSRQYINPYVHGILSNWRIDTTYVFYGERKNNAIPHNPSSPYNTQNNIDAQIDLRTAGLIENYETFWNQASSASALLTRNTDAADKWVWNSAITQFNRKGYEIENTDPLGRYNAGLYGYNDQLPVAVANNSRVAEVMFDGFEDHEYSTGQSACITCKPPKRVKYTGLQQSNLNADQSHSGMSSLRVMPTDQIKIEAPVVTKESIKAGFSLRAKVDSVATSNVLSNNHNGTGFTAKYYKHSPTASGPLEPGGSAPIIVTTGVPNITGGLIHNNVSQSKYSVKWKGTLQVSQSGNQKILVLSSYGGFRIRKNGESNPITTPANWNTLFATNNNSANNSALINLGNLPIGEKIVLEIDYYTHLSGSSFNVLLLNPSNSLGSNSNNFQLIPLERAYQENATIFNTLTQSNWCSKLNELQVKDNALTDNFKLIQGRDMLIGTWVKEATTDCKCSNYEKSKIKISFEGSTQTYTFKPKGNIIDGWQRIEEEFTIPNGATKLFIEFINETNTTANTIPAFFDDLRIQPREANMKSFVYHPSNLRLIGELDENNYATFYEYDDEGTLARVKKETQRGIKTISETRSSNAKKIPVE
jgi:hypothetical protein